MRCLACNKELTDFEATRKYINTNDFIDLCNECYKEIKDDIVAEEREDLKNSIDESEEK